MNYFIIILLYLSVGKLKINYTTIYISSIYQIDCNKILVIGLPISNSCLRSY